MVAKEEIVKCLNKSALFYSEQTKDGDWFISLSQVDINIFQGGSLEINVYSLDKSIQEPIFSKYFPMLKSDELKKVMQFIEAFSRKAIVEYEHPIWGSAVAIKTHSDTYTEPFDSKKKVSFTKQKGIY